MANQTAADILIAAQNSTDYKPVQRHDLLLPAAGNWSMRAEMAGSSVLPDGPVTIVYSGSQLTGYVTRAGDDRGQYIGIIVGGKAQTAQQGLDKQVTAQHYYQTPAQSILQATLSQVGEQLASDSQGLTQLLDYPRRAVAASEVLDEIADLLGCIWRVKLDGTVWLGAFTWPATSAQFVYESKQPDLAAPLLMPMPYQPLIEPGQSIVLDTSASSALDKTAQRVLCAHYYGDEKLLEARLWFQDPNADLVTDDKLAPDRVHAGIAAIARSACRGTDWYRNFQGDVVVQRSDGTLDVNLDRVMGKAEMPPIRGAKVSVPVGGAVLSVRAGDRVTIFYEGGDPRKPRAAGYETGNATRGVARLNDTVKQSSGFTTWASAITTAVNALAKTAIVPPVDPIGSISSASTDLKLRD